MIRYILLLSALVAVAYGQAAPATPTAAPSAQKVAKLTNADIIALKQAGFGDDLIILKITASGADYKLQVDDLVELKKAGISANVMASMIQSSVGNSTTATATVHINPPPALDLTDHTISNSTSAQGDGPCDPGWKQIPNSGCEPETAPVVQSVADQIKVGQTITEVHALIGKPNRPTTRRQWEEWNILSDGKQVILEVQYSADGVVLWAHRFVDQSNGNTPKDIQDRREWANRDRGVSGQSEAPNLADKIVNVGQGLLLSHYCPQIYRTPLVLMNANTAQWLKSCDANGFMLFGLYVYTGPNGK